MAIPQTGTTIVGDSVFLEDIGGGDAGMPAVDGSNLTGIVTGVSEIKGMVSRRVPNGSPNPTGAELIFLRSTGGVLFLRNEC